MRISTKGRFAVIAMIDLALNESAVPLPLSSIAARHHISLSYLEQMFSKLRQRNLVESTRGPGGGYMLERAAATISLADIVGAIEMDEDGFIQPPEPAALDVARELWDELNAKMMDHMQTISLEHLADVQRAKGYKVERRKSPRTVVTRTIKPEPVYTRAPNSVFALAETMFARG